MKSLVFFLATVGFSTTSSAVPLSSIIKLNARDDKQTLKLTGQRSCQAGMLPSAPPGIKCYDNLYFSEVTPPPGYYGFPPDGSFENCNVPNQGPPPDIRCYRVSDGVEVKPGGVYGGPIPNNNDKKISNDQSKKNNILKDAQEDRFKNDQQDWAKGQAKWTKNDKNLKRRVESDHHSGDHHHSGEQPRNRKGYLTITADQFKKNYRGPVLIDDPPRIPVQHQDRHPTLSGISKRGDAHESNKIVQTGVGNQFEKRWNSGHGADVGRINSHIAHEAVRLNSHVAQDANRFNSHVIHDANRFNSDITHGLSHHHFPRSAVSVPEPNPQPEIPLETEAGFN